MNKKSEIAKIIKGRESLTMRLFYEGLLVGLIAGSICIGYRLLLTYAESIYFMAAAFVRTHLVYIVLWFLGLALLGFIISKFMEWEPYIGGSGIPQVEAEVQGHIDQCWWRVIFAKIFAGSLSVLGGLSLGREGPSIQLGAMAAKGLSQSQKRTKTEERFLMTCGAAAGLSAAFNAPLAGIMFALEEVHKNFSTAAMVSVMCASVVADFISSNVFGLSPTLHFAIHSTLRLYDYGWVILLGIVAGLAGAFYNTATLKTIEFYKKVPFLKKSQYVLIPLMVSGVLGLYLPLVMGGGHHLVEYLNEPHLMMRTLVVLLIAKFAFSTLSFGSGTAGGIFFPLLIIGSLIGAIFGKLAIMAGVPELYFMNFIILAMSAYFAAIVRAPITGIVLIAEMSGTLKMLLPIALVSFVAYFVANLLHSEPIYEGLMNNLLKNKKPEDEEFDIVNQKEMVAYTISLGSDAADLMIKDLSLPAHCLIVSIVRGQREIIPKGHTKLYIGDRVIVLLDKYHIDETKMSLEQIFTFN